MKYRTRALEVPLTLPDGRRMGLCEEDESPQEGSIVLLEDDEEWSGLYDSEGNPLFRVREKVGFV